MKPKWQRARILRNNQFPEVVGHEIWVRAEPPRTQVAINSRTGNLLDKPRVVIAITPISADAEYASLTAAKICETQFSGGEPIMSDPIVSLQCEGCGKPCTASFNGDHLGSDTHHNPECYGGHYLLRRITDDEEADIIADLYAEADAERTPAERARHRWLNDS